MPSEYYFLSYSAADGREQALWLAEQLRRGSPPIEVWLDTERLAAGFHWDDQLAEALRRAKGVLFVETPDSVNPKSFCGQEIAIARSYRKHIVPLKFGAPKFQAQIETLQRIDFTGERPAALAKLREHLVWLDTLEGRLKRLRDQLDYAKLDWNRATSDGQRARIRKDIDLLQEEIVQLEALAHDPVEAARRAQESIEQRLALSIEKPKSLEARNVRIVHSAPTEPSPAFQNRYVEIGLLIDFVNDASRRMAVLVGRGGIGKTSMVCRFLRVLEQGESWEKFGRVLVDGIVYLATNGPNPITAANILRDLCEFLPAPVAARVQSSISQSGQPIGAKVAEVLAALTTGRYVLLLDNFELLLDGESGKIVDRELHDALTAILRGPHHGVKVVVTTRTPLREFALVEPSRQFSHVLGAGLAEPFAENLLRALDFDGHVGLRDAPATQLARARELTLGHPRALEALFGILSADRSQTLDELLQQSAIHLPEEVAKVYVGEAFSRLGEMAQRVMQALAIYARPVPEVAVDFLLMPFQLGIACASHLRALVNMQLVRKSSGLFHLHPIDAAYALERLPPGSSSSSASEVSLWTLRRRAVEYHRRKRRAQEDWKSIGDVEEGELAEFEILVANAEYEAAFELIRRLEYHLMLWGEGGRLAYLNERLEKSLTLPASQMSCTGSRALGLELQGKYNDALPAYDSALTQSRQIGDRDAEVSFLGNRAICHARLGRGDEAIESHRRALELLGYGRASIWEWFVGRRESWQTAVHLNGLGCRLFDRGENEEALRTHDSAIAVARQKRDEQFGEYFLSGALESRAQVLIALDRFDEAEHSLRESLALGERIASAQSQSHAEFSLACIELFRGRWHDAQRQAMLAAERQFHETRHQSLYVAGAAQLLAGEIETAQQTLDHAIHYCRRQLEFAESNIIARYVLGISLCARACCASQDGDELARDGIEELRKARACNKHLGIVSRFSRLLEPLRADAHAARATAAQSVLVG